MSGFSAAASSPSSSSGGSLKNNVMFSRAVWPGAARSFEGVCSRAWHFKLQDDSYPESLHKVIFRHGIATGNWVLIIDGQTIQNGFVRIVNRKFDVPFLIDSRYSAIVRVNGKSGMGYSHVLELTKDEKQIQEVKRSPTEQLSVGEHIPENISIPDSRKLTLDGKEVILYQICVQTAGQPTVVVERRFSEFITLGNLLKSQKDQFSFSLPSSPPKIFSPWIDQRSESFVNERRTALQKYLCDLLRNSRVCHYTEFLLFLGLSPITGLGIQNPASGMSILFSDDEEEGFLP